MELTEQVKIALDEAEDKLREALSFASKTENPIINVHISNIISTVHQVKNYYNKPQVSPEDVFRRFFS